MSDYELPAEGKGYSYFERRRAIPTFGHFHGAFEFVFQKDGEQEVLVGGEKRVMRGGDACFVNGFFVHSYFPKEPTNCYIIVANRDSFERIFRVYDGKKPPRFFRFENFALLDELYGFYQKNFKNATNRQLNFDGLARILTAELAETVDFVDSDVAQRDSLICQLLVYAEENYGKDLSLCALAKKFGYSREHLSRVLHKYLAENWNGYVGRLRARRVEETLGKEKNANVLDVAFACGFESANTFYRAYKKAFGHAPRQFLT